VTSTPPSPKPAVASQHTTCAAPISRRVARPLRSAPISSATTRAAVQAVARIAAATGCEIAACIGSITLPPFGYRLHF